MRVLLDTCAFLWIVAGSPELSREARRIYADPENEVFLSPVSLWEIMVKNAIGKLPLPEPVAEFLERQRVGHQIDSLPLDAESVYRLQELPLHHRDPFDRMLVCQAIHHGLTLISPDPLLRPYPVQCHW